MPLISELFCFAVFDGGPGDEGIPAFGEGRFLLPMMGKDLAMVERLIPIAQKFADDSGKSIRIYKFTGKEQIGEVNPRSEAERKVFTVHALRNGYSACGFGMPSTPVNWPEGHMWTGSDERSKVTCRKCLEALGETTG